MKTYETMMVEEKGKAIVFTFGRFQPPTAGHQLLIDKVKQVAKKEKAEYRIYPSSTFKPDKNPLKHKEKISYMKKFFRGANIVNDSTIVTPFDALKSLSDEGYKNVTLVVGGDRVSEFESRIRKYIGGKDGYQFDSFKVVSAGKRDPDAEDISGMSASKMRKAASDGDFKSFSSGLPSNSKKTDIKKLYDLLRTRMGIRENTIVATSDDINKRKMKKPLEDGTDEAREDRQRLTPGQSVEKYTEETMDYIDLKRNLNERFGGDTNIPADKKTKDLIQSGKAKILINVKSSLHKTARFVVIERPLGHKGKLSSNQDKVLMATISDPKSGRIKMFAFHGSHVNHQGAMKFAKHHKLVAKEDAKGNPLYAKESYLDEAGDPRIAKLSNKSKEMLASLANAMDTTGGPFLDSKNVKFLTKKGVDDTLKAGSKLNLSGGPKKFFALIKRELGESVELDEWGTSYDQDRQIGDIVKKDRKKRDAETKRKWHAMMKKKKPKYKKGDKVTWKGKKGTVVRYDKSGPQSPFYVVSFKGQYKSENIPQHKLDESVKLDESKMSEFHMHVKDGKTAQQIAKIMKIDLKTVKELMKGMKESIFENKKEDIVMNLKKKTAYFKKKYGDRWKEVMYATANKLAKEDMDPETAKKLGIELPLAGKGYPYQEPGTKKDHQSLNARWQKIKKA